MNFTMNEFERSDTARMYGIDNTIPYPALQNIYRLIKFVLQPARDRLGLPIRINSGYRCPVLNQLVKGAPSSQHVLGQAADITCSDNERLFQILKELPFDQLIVYRDKRNHARILWIHVSYNEEHLSHKSFAIYQ